MVLIEDANALLTQVSGLALSIIALVGIALKFALSKSHNPRLVALETTLAQVKGGVEQLQADKPEILKTVAVVGTLVPQLTKADEAAASKIAVLEKDLADAKAKVDLLSTVVPVVAAVTPPISSKQAVETKSAIQA
jgi:hypothetical protein